MTENEAIEMGLELLEAHGLRGPRCYDTLRKYVYHQPSVVGPWRIVIDRRTSRRAGQVRFRNREIGISDWLVEHNEESRIRNTILHEIAHALTPGHGHDRVWKATARAIGCNGDPCYQAGEVKRPPLPWQGVCPSGHRHELARAPRAGAIYGCMECTRSFNDSNIISWTRSTP